jgi:gamma-glutamyltranspeptidase / glutathione hydrolase
LLDKFLVNGLCFFLFLIQTPINAQTFARNGMVVSATAEASETGIEILKKGGNAIDAAVAIAFALEVTYPAAGNIGGGGFIVYMDSSGKATTIDFREKAPLKATATMFLNEQGKLAKMENAWGRESTINHTGLKSAGVPGTVAGLYLAHQKYGSLPWAELVQPAIELAQKGIALSWQLSRQAVYLDSASGTSFLKNYFRNDNGDLLQFAETWKQPALAHTLREIRDHGHDGFYKGPLAKEIARYMQENGGIISREDLAQYQAVERTPIHGTYKGYDVYSMPPPSSGGVALVEMLNLAEQAELDSIEFNSTAYVHIMAEIMRRAYADRAEYLGDPDFNNDMPLDKLLSKSFARERFESIDMQLASASDSARFGQLYDSDHTTHFSVTDKHGNAVALTYTLERSYGCGMGSPKLGFIFNNEMGDFNPVPGFTSSKGLIGTAANTIQPGKRMLSSMTPTIVAKEGKPYLVIGTPGGRTIINLVFQAVLNVMQYDMRIDQAIEVMKIHHQWLPDVITYEKYLLSPDTRKNLEDMGHTLRAVRALGTLMGIQVDKENNIFIGASDSNSPGGTAKGY